MNFLAKQGSGGNKSKQFLTLKFSNIFQQGLHPLFLLLV
jgi:hypothetical protein